MKKLIALFAITGIILAGISNNSFAQGKKDTKAPATETAKPDTTKTVAADTTKKTEALAQTAVTEEVEEVKTFHQVLKEKFIEGGAGFMSSILLCFILGLALVIERIIYLNMSSTNTRKLLANVESAFETGGVKAAMEVCRTTRGPVASIFFQGLSKFNSEVKESLEIVEKSIVSYGSVMMGRLEKGVSWISLFIALAPMLGFLGTVIGMVQAFDAIERAGDISPTVVSAGIKVALITTVFGLIVAIILQVCYNYIISKVDSLVNEMEDSSITFIDILAKHQK